MQKGQRITATSQLEAPNTWIQLTNDRCDGVKCENVDGAMFGSARVEAARHRAAEWAAASTTLRAAGTRPPRTNVDHPAHPSRLYLYLILVHACNANDFFNVMGFGCGIFYLQQEGKNVSCEEVTWHIYPLKILFSIS